MPGSKNFEGILKIKANTTGSECILVFKLRVTDLCFPSPLYLSSYTFPLEKIGRREENLYPVTMATIKELK